MRNYYAFFLLAILLTGNLFAQTNPKWKKCSTVEVDAMRRAQDPTMETPQQFENWLTGKIAAMSSSGMQTFSSAVKTIPVVFHVCYGNGTENIPDAMILSQVDVLNEDFRRLNADATNTLSAFQPAAADCEVEFCLATIDPNGNPTNGITRNFYSGSPYSQNYVENTIKPATSWDPTQYMNIWVCNVSGGVLGYAYLPSSAPISGLPGAVAANKDGVVLLYSSIGRPPANTFGGPYNLGRTATHEVGHFLGLHHVWESLSCGGCTAGCDDYCNDTPNQNSANFGCPSNPVSCSSADMYQNFMDYVDDNCMNLFTNDQKARITAVLANSPRRASLTTSTKCGAALAPVASFTSDVTSVCPGGVVNFTDNSANNPTSWSWSFPGGTPSTSTAQNPTIAYATAGTYNVTLTSTNSVGSDTDIQTGYVVVAYGNVKIIFEDDFESGNFTAANWTVTNPDALNTWEIATVAGNTPGTKAARVDMYNNNHVGARDCLSTPSLDFSGYTSVSLSFEHAHRRYSTNEQDSLVIYVSTNGGSTWPIRIFADAENGSQNFATNTATTANFVPATATDWCISGTWAACKTLSLATWDNTPNMAIKFETVNDYGNNIYIDNVVITGTCSNISSQPPVSQFTANNTSGCGSLAVTFTDQSTNSPTSWAWNFGDGNTSTSQNPSHTYSSPGTYTVTLVATNTAGNDSEVKTNYITVFAAPTASISGSVNATCGNSNGSATATQSGGTGPFTYSWNTTPVQTTATATNLGAGSYTVTVTDANSCNSTANVTLTNIAGPGVSITSSQNSSCLGNDGSATALATGGTGPISYSWNTTPVQTTATATNLAAGSYTVTVTDANTCTATANVTITSAGAPTVSISSFTDESCGDSSGTATAAGSGGTGPLSYAWNTVPVQTGATATGLKAGTYTVTVTDGASCTGTANVTIANSTSVQVFFDDFESNNFTAKGWTVQNPDGFNTWAVVTSAGNGPGTKSAYVDTYNNNHVGARDQLITPVLDLTGVGSVNLDFKHAHRRYSTNEQDSLIIYVSTDGGSTWPDRVFADAENGSKNFATNTLQTTNFIPANANDWCFGAAGWSGCKSINLSAYDGMSNVRIRFEIYNDYGNNIHIDDVSVAGVCQTVLAPVADFSGSVLSGCGSLTTTFSDLSTNNPTSWSWTFSGGSPSSSTQQNPTVSYSTPGTYSVSLTSTNAGGSDTDTKATYITVFANPTASVPTKTDATCGNSNGTATATQSGGTGPYTYSWNTTPVQTTATATGLVAGSYTVTVTDANSCTSTANVTIGSVGGPTASVPTKTDATCGNSNGTATASQSGGTGPFTYSWNTTPVQTTATATGLAAGSYTVTVTDANSCTSTANVTIANTGGPTASVPTKTDATCGNSNGTATATQSGGTGPFSYSWNTAPVQTTATATGLAAGSYTVTVTDANSCTSTASVTIGSVGGPTASVPTKTDATCGNSNGTATATQSGGTGPYSYSWNTTPVQTTATATGLAAGSYTVTVTDVNSCTSTANVTIGSVGGPTASVPTKIDATCGNSNGTATATQSGGTGPFSYSWNTTPVQTTATATGLAAGSYTVTVTDANSCTSTANVTIGSTGGPTASVPTKTDATCGNSNGTATATQSGGTGPYTYSWNTTPVQTTATATGLAAGSYTVTVTDANSCTSTANVTIGSVGGPTASVPTKTDAACGNSNGTATATQSGGTGPFTYSWNTTPVQTTATATGLAAGSYTVTVTDANSCTSTANVTIGSVGGPTASVPTKTDATCGNSNGTATATQSGGTGPFSYSWNTTPVQTTATATGLAAGSYTVTVTDANSCTSTANVTIGSVGGPTASVPTKTDATCGNSNGTATATQSGGTGPYTYSWNTTPVQTTATATGLAAGSYTVTVTDANSCTSTANVTIGSVGGPTASVPTKTDATCGNSNGTATATQSGGTGPFTYSWNTTPVQTTATATGLAAGSYTVTVTDANSCTSTASVTISALAGPTASISGSSNATCGLNNGTATATQSGGTGPFTYAWNTTPVQATATANGLAAGNYTVTVTDANSCTSTASVTIGSVTPPQVSVTGIGNANCGNNNGTATAVVTGGTGPFSFLWNTSPAQTTATASGLAPGNYQVTVTDANNCQATASITIGSSGGPSAVISGFSDAPCGQAAGAASVLVSGGTGPYSYSWNTSPVQTSPTAVGLIPGSYTVTVTDFNGCMTTATATIGNIPGPSLSLALWQDVTCNGGGDGTATVIATGGTGPYNYIWNTTPVQNTSTAILLTAGTYECYVTDLKGCKDTLSVTISEPPALVVTISTTPETPGQNDGTATANASGGIPPYTYLWNNGQTTATATGLSAGVYTCTVLDSAGCDQTVTDSVNVFVGLHDELDPFQVEIYPNPTEGSFNLALEMSHAAEVQVEVYNKIGQIIFTQSLGQVREGTFQLSPDEIAAGVYFVRVAAGTETVVRKLLVIE
ncbi:MAG: PKD domain-containing protein [Bacteroidia bacterium]|nr:PKD domain-containing protein [Bacteroidia bacterium]